MAAELNAYISFTLKRRLKLSSSDVVWGGGGEGSDVGWGGGGEGSDVVLGGGGEGSDVVGS